MKIKQKDYLYLFSDFGSIAIMTYCQTARSQPSHEDCGPSSGRLTPRPPDRSATLRVNELAEAVAQCVVHDTVSQDKALWHTEPKVMLKCEENSKRVTQQGPSRDSCVMQAASLLQSV